MLYTLLNIDFEVIFAVVLTTFLPFAIGQMIARLKGAMLEACAVVQEKRS